MAKPIGDLDVLDEDQDDEEDDADDADRRVLAAQVGGCALLDGGREAAHRLVAGRQRQQRPRRQRPVEHGGTPRKPARRGPRGRRGSRSREPLLRIDGERRARAPPQPSGGLTRRGSDAGAATGEPAAADGRHGRIPRGARSVRRAGSAVLLPGHPEAPLRCAGPAPPWPPGGLRAGRRAAGRRRAGRRRPGARAARVGHLQLGQRVADRAELGAVARLDDRPAAPARPRSPCAAARSRASGPPRAARRRRPCARRG